MLKASWFRVNKPALTPVECWLSLAKPPPVWALESERRLVGTVFLAGAPPLLLAPSSARSEELELVQPFPAIPRSTGQNKLNQTRRGINRKSHKVRSGWFVSLFCSSVV